MIEISPQLTKVDYSKLDDASLAVAFTRASRENDREVREPAVCQLVLRAVPVIAGAVARYSGTRGFSSDDLALIEDEAMCKLLLRLDSSETMPNVTTLAHELARECAEDPDRRPAGAPKVSPPRPALRLLPGGRDSAEHSHQGGRFDG